MNGQVSIASMYFDGKGVPEDRSESARWCRGAAEQGDPQAQYGLSIFYSRGQGVPQDYAEAVRWCHKSADQGYSKAQYALGFMLYHGYGVQRDRVQTNDLFEQAAAHGNEDAKRALECDRKGISIDPRAGLRGPSIICMSLGAAHDNRCNRGDYAS